jgi:hypothetical protein
MTLGCGGWGGNITSDNISPRHLLNIKRLAWEITPAVVRQPSAPATAATSAPAAPGLPKPPAGPPVPGGIAADVLARRIDEFLTSRGYRGPSTSAPQAGSPTQADVPPKGGSYLPPGPPPPAKEPAAVAPTEKPADFVCEDDVRQALRQQRKIVIGERSIVTPAARDLGEQHRIFVQASWPR